MISPTELSVEEGDSAKLDVQLTGASSANFDPSKVTWTTDDPSIAEVRSDGTLVAKRAGEVQVKAVYGSLWAFIRAWITQTPRRVEAASSTDLSGVVGRALAEPVRVRVLSFAGSAVSGTTVHFQVLSGAGDVRDAVVETDGQGIAATIWTLGTDLGSQEMKAWVEGLPEVVFEAQALPDYSAAVLQVIRGDEQEGEVGSVLPDPLRVEVTDTLGNPLPGVPVEWSFTSGGGTESASASSSGLSSPYQASTDDQGYAEVYWKLGPEAGAQEAVSAVQGQSSSPSAKNGASKAFGNGKSARFEALAQAGPLTSVAVSPDSATLEVTESQQFSAEARDAHGNLIPNASFTWSSTDTNVVTVDGDGLAVAKGAGSVTVEATAQNHSGSAAVTVLPPPDDKLVKVSGDGQSGTVATTLDEPLKVRVVDGYGEPISGRTVTWTVIAGGGSVSPASVTTDAQGYAETSWTLGAELGGNGVSAAVDGIGSVTFGATAQPIASITISPETLSFTSLEDTLSLTATAEDSGGTVVDGLTMSWQSTNTEVATVDDMGRVVSKGTGTFMIIVSAVCCNAADSATGTSEQEVSSVSVSPESVSVLEGESYQFHGVAQDRNGFPIPAADITWATGDSAIATVTGGGVATALAAGETTITAEVDGHAASALFKVDPQPTDSLIKLGGDGQTGTVGTPLADPLQVRVVDGYGDPLEGRGVTWTVTQGGGSLEPASSTTDSQGYAEATLTLCTEPGANAATAEVEGVGALSFTATGEVGPVAVITVEPDSATINEGQDRQFSASAEDAFGNPLSGVSFTWAVDDSSVASITGGGLASGVASGAAVVSASAGDATGTAELTVQPAPEEAFEIASGNGQSGTVGTELAEAPTVRLLDGYGNPVEGQVVAWAVTAGGGSINPTSNTTDAQGYAQTTWTLGTSPGANSIMAAVDGVGTLTFSATAETGPVASITVEPESASIEEGQDQQFSASAEDSYGNPLSSTTFAWSLSDSSVASINSDGLASGLVAGTTTVSASAGGVTGDATLAITAAPAQEDPGTVTDLSVASVSDSTVTLTWTEVDDGTGNPAKYALRYGTPTISWGDAYPTEVSVEGSNIGSPIQYTWEGLEPGTDYEFQLVSYRGTLSVDAVFGGWSDVVSATTDASSSGDSIQKISGDGQSATVGTSLSDPLSVRVVDASGAGVQGHTVTWTVTAGGGSVSPSSSTTDADGYAETTWRLGTSAGGNGVSAAVDGLGSVSFGATGLAGPVASVVVTPDSASIEVGQTQQFSAQAEDEYGNTVGGVSFEWTSSDAAVVSVSASGLAEGGDEGAADISALSGGVAGSGSVTVQSVTEVPEWQHEPADYTLFTDWSAASDDDPNWDVLNRASLTTNGTAPFSPDSVLQFYYPEGEGPSTVGGGIANFTPPPEVTEVYLGFYVKFSDPWDEHASNHDSPKLVFFRDTGTGYWGEPFYIRRGSDGYIDGKVQNSGAPPNRYWLEQNVGSVRVDPGGWHLVEVLVKTNTPGENYDGEFHLWIDGTKVCEWTDIWFSDAESPAWTDVDFQPLWGGQDDTLAHDNFLWVDHVRISGK